MFPLSGPCEQYDARVSYGAATANYTNGRAVNSRHLLFHSSTGKSEIKVSGKTMRSLKAPGEDVFHNLLVASVIIISGPQCSLV